MGKTTQQLKTQVNNTIFSNGQGQILASEHNLLLNDILDSVNNANNTNVNIYTDADKLKVDNIVILNSTDDLSEGTTNLYYTDTRVSNNADVLLNVSMRHDHSNKIQIDQITNAGSGSIITSVERTKLSNIEDGAEVNTVTSVNSQVNDVVLDTSDISEDTNLYYTDTRVSANSDVTANTSARHTHSNKTILDNTEESFTTSQKNKLDSVDEDAEKNVNADWNSSSGDSEILNKPNIPNELDDLSDVDTSSASNGNVLQYNGTDWTPATISTGSGDMEKSVYDPTGVNGDTFNYNNFTNTPTDLTDLSTHTVTELSDVSSVGSGKIITDSERTKLDNLNEDAEENVNADWDATSGDSEILNKPNIPSTTDDITEASNLYYTDTRVSNNSDVSSNTTNRHTHSNKTLLDSLIDTGSASKFLAEDGNYDQLFEEDISNFNRTRWYNKWMNIEYVKNDMVNDDGWLMVANNTTTDRAKPISVGTPYYLYDGTLTNVTYPNDINYLAIGQEYEALDAGYIEGFRFYVQHTTGYRYRLVHADVTDVNDIQYTIGQIYEFADAGVKEINTDPIFVLKGHKFRFFLLIQNHNTTPTETVLDYDYSTPRFTTDPSSGEIVHDNMALDTLKVSKTDKSGDQSTYLATLKVGDYIEMETQSWEIITISEQTDFYNFTVTPSVQYGSDGRYNVSFFHYVPAAIEYTKEDNYWSSKPNVKGLIQEDGFDNPTENDNAYPIDILLQDASISPYWDFMTTMSKLGNMSDTNAGGDMVKAVYDPTNVEGDAFDYNNFNNTPDLSTYQTKLEDVYVLDIGKNQPNIYSRINFSTDSENIDAITAYFSIGGSTTDGLARIRVFIYDDDTSNLQEQAVFFKTGLKLKNGGYVNEFSSDGTLADDSDSVLPTEKAVKTYVDTNTVGKDETGTTSKVDNLWSGTQAEYDGLGSYDDNTIYFIQ